MPPAEIVRRFVESELAEKYATGIFVQFRRVMMRPLLFVPNYKR